MLKTKFPVFSISLLVCFCLVLMGIPARAQRFSPLSYIDANKNLAKQYMEQYGLPASVILAVAMHESAHGNSKIARYLNNHFGIKGKNNGKKIRSSYKEYGSVHESYEDFVSCLKNRSNFNHLFEKFRPNDYRSWTLGIAHGGYASSKSWASQVIGMIEKYQLYLYDQLPGDDTVAAAQPDPAVTMADEASDKPLTYSVKKGDTLSEIAEKHEISVSDIRRKNTLRSSRLKIGQKLLL